MPDKYATKLETHRWIKALVTLVVSFCFEERAPPRGVEFWIHRGGILRGCPGQVLLAWWRLLSRESVLPGLDTTNICDRPQAFMPQDVDRGRPGAINLRVCRTYSLTRKNTLFLVGCPETSVSKVDNGQTKLFTSFQERRQRFPISFLQRRANEIFR